MTPLVRTVNDGNSRGGVTSCFGLGYSLKKEKELRNRLVVGLLALMMAFAIPVLAQTDTGIISGRITDSSGAVVPNAQIIATQTATNVDTASAADADGIYRLPGLRDGPYKLAVSAPGFKKLVREGLHSASARTCP